MGPSERGDTYASLVSKGVRPSDVAVQFNVSVAAVSQACARRGVQAMTKKRKLAMGLPVD